jgi:hypothetical protein
MLEMRVTAQFGQGRSPLNSGEVFRVVLLR